MITAATAFETTMIICWGVSWPSAVLKTYRAKNVSGISIVFAPITSVVHFYQLVDQLNIVADSMGIDRLEKDKFKI